MQLRNREAYEFVGRESCLLDFPTAEELMAALEARLVVAPLLSTDLDAAPPRGRERADVLEPELIVEPEFMLDFATFLLARLQQRTAEMRQAQGQLSDELARLRLCQ